MSDYEREPPLAFDPRRPVRGAGPVPVTLIVSGLILIALIGGVFFFYRGGIRHANDAPAPVGTPLGDIKSAAPPDGASNDATAGLTIFKTDNSNAAAANAAAPTFVPPPEEPQPRPGAPVAAAPAGAAPAAQPAVVNAVPPPPAPPVQATQAKPAKPLTIASLTDAANAPKPAAAKPASKPAVKIAAAAAAAPTAGAGWVQIGAFSSPALAEKGWTAIARLEPAAMAGKGKKVEPMTKGGEALYRTYITGFSSKASAQAFCDKLKAAGKSCLVK
ncbi:MAG: SPOR domain-containing protein [Caulobacterales bacterium]